MKILLVNPPIREHEPPRHPPFGLATIAALLLEEGHSVEVLDINAQRLSETEVVRRLGVKNDYGIIGTGGLITTYKYLKWLIPELRKHNPNSKIVIGGGVVTSCPQLLLNKTPADIAVIGEGEITMRDLAADLPLDKIKGILYKKDGGIIQNPPRELIKDLDSLPFPAWDLFPMEIYISNMAHASLIGKKTELSFITCRGCPYNCDFCYHIFGKGCRVQSIGRIIEEIKRMLEKYRIEAIAFLDETLTIDKKRIVEFCERYQKEIKLPWSCFARVNLVDKEILRMMKRAGCFRVGYGIESGSQRILDRMHKGVTVDEAKRALKLTRECRLYVNTTFMFGYPGENLETIRETYNFCKDLVIRPNFFYTTPYPGTALYNDVRNRIIEKYGDEEKFIEELDDATKFTINLTDFSEEELIRLKKETEIRLIRLPFYRYPKLIYILYLQLGVSYVIKRIIGVLRRLFLRLNKNVRKIQ